MKLSKFPYLVQKEIFDHMKHSNLFSLSLVSNNIKKLIKSSQTVRFQSISRITYRNLVNKWHVGIPFKTKNMGTMEEYQGTELIMTMSNLDDTKHACFQLNVSGKSMDFRVSDKYRIPEAYFHPSHKGSAFEIIHNYLLDFFGNTVEHIWQAKSYNHFIPQLPNLSLWVTIRPDRSEMVKNLDTFFDSSPALKHINIEWIKLLLISPESKFYQAESIKIIQPRSPTVNIFLRNFKGRQATLLYCKCEVSDLIEFMNRWRSGEHSRKLEYLRIRFTPGPALKPNTDPIISHFYIVRETDYRVASVSIQGSDFRFGVWRETEEEFLRIVE
ncbi:hypothetical protein B9Z55_009172 [Caenorhabditis nigoni]|uniref:F-box domain-containing protein n=2 Tax=Caenorhabditis nigoni TaxID=1611254 RepID=A0A2G5UQV5_9PELO|nr:hypothetical protein B9Z55_009172 [Caenorhabditis nigoni]